jgi:hypothetical protein
VTQSGHTLKLFLIFREHTINIHSYLSTNLLFPVKNYRGIEKLYNVK